MVDVNIGIITYNHGKYIGQALDSILGQETNYTYKIIIGDDCSTDDTRETLKYYKDKHPDKIELLLNEKNKGPIGNLRNVYNSCNAEFVTLIEGDDYWLDKNKLQIQIDKLKNNPQIATVCAKSRICKGTVLTEEVFPNVDGDRVFTIEEMFEGSLISTISLMWKKSSLEQFPEWIDDTFIIADFPMNILRGTKGEIYFMDKELTVYRKHSTGITKATDKKKWHKEFIKVYEGLKNNIDTKYTTSVDRALAKEKLHLAIAYCIEYDFINAKKEFNELIILDADLKNCKRGIMVRLCLMFKYIPAFILRKTISIRRAMR